MGERAETAPELLATVVDETLAPSLSANNSVTTMSIVGFTFSTRKEDATCTESAKPFADRQHQELPCGRLLSSQAQQARSQVQQVRRRRRLSRRPAALCGSKGSSSPTSGTATAWRATPPRSSLGTSPSTSPALATRLKTQPTTAVLSTERRCGSSEQRATA